MSNDTKSSQCNLRVRLTERNPRTGQYVRHNIMKFDQLRDEILRANRSYFFMRPVIGLWRRKTLEIIMETIKRLAE